jgi:hypothetical protein
MADQLNQLWAYAEATTKEELLDKTPITHQDITSDQLEGLVDKIDQALQGVEADPKVKNKIKYIKKNWPGKVKQYEDLNKDLFKPLRFIRPNVAPTVPCVAYVMMTKKNESFKSTID